MPVEEATARAEIARVLDDWHDAAATADENRYFSHFASDAVFMGTDATERWDREAFREYAHPHFARGRAWTFRAARREVALGPGARIAWFDEDLDTENLGPARGTGVMVREPGGEWRIAHYNLTITVPNERFGEVHALLEDVQDSSTTSPVHPGGVRAVGAGGPRTSIEAEPAAAAPAE